MISRMLFTVRANSLWEPGDEGVGGGEVFGDTFLDFQLLTHRQYRLKISPIYGHHQMIYQNDLFQVVHLVCI